MVTTCVICGIKYGTPNVSFHRFPKDSARCDVWAQQCNLKDLMNKPDGMLNRSTRVCSKHFQPHQFNGKRLMYAAIPSSYLNKG